MLKDLIKKMLLSAEERITIENIFKHPWMKIEPRKVRIAVDYNSLIEYSKFSKLKKIAANYLALQMTSKELRVYEEMFEKLDENKDGFISADELRASLRQDSSKSETANLF